MLTELRAPIATELQDVDLFIKEQLKSSIPLINEISKYIVNSSGKRIRPLLLLLGAKACNYNGNTHIAMATVIEFIHTATLLHDDVVDLSTIRRNKKTANAKWGSSAAVLVGDFLYSRAFQIMNKVNNLTIMQIMADATNMIAEGEVAQLLNLNNANTSETDYLTVIRNKTAKLFEAATEIGAVISDQPTHIRVALRHFGLHLGTAYQIIDDLLDYTATETLGKDLGKDLYEGKPTLPLIHAIDVAKEADQKLLIKAINKPKSVPVEEVIAIFRRTKSFLYAKRFAKREAQLAKEALSELPNSIYKNNCFDLIDFCLEREF